MRYLIINGCGFFGSNLAHEVLAPGATLCVLTTFLAPAPEFNSNRTHKRRDKTSSKDVGKGESVNNAA